MDVGLPIASAKSETFFEIGSMAAGETFSEPSATCSAIQVTEYPVRLLRTALPPIRPHVGAHGTVQTMRRPNDGTVYRAEPGRHS
jgi:hypothetical protein